MVNAVPVILNVNDDAASRCFTSRAMRLAGFTVVEAANGHEALALADERTDVVILDVHLPDLSGMEVCQRLKRAPRTRSVFVLHLSAQGVSPIERAQALELGADAYLGAPLDPDELIAQVNALLRLRRAEHQVLALSDQVARERRLLELALASAVDASALFDREGRLLLCNPAARELLRVGEDAAGRTARELVAREPALKPYALAVEAALRTGQPQEGTLTRDDDPRGTRHYEYTLSPAPGPGGGVEAVMCTARDVTERREAEAFREQFLGWLGHDLRNPLNALSMSAQQLQRMGGMGEVQTSLTRRMLSSTKRMERMIHQLLDYARARLGKALPISRAPCDFFEVCRRCLDELRASYPDRQVVLELQGDGRGTWDADRLEQVVANLVTNALRYCPEDGVVQVRGEGTDAEVALRVHNTGEPIPPELLPHLFDAWRRGGRAHEGGADTGLGLGLFITRQVLHAHGGTVQVTSTQHEGTAFTVRLPR